MNTIKKVKKSSNEVLKEFVFELSKSLNIPFEEFENGFKNKSSETLIYNKKKFKLYRDEKFGEYYWYENDAYKLIFFELNENIIELHWIEVNYKNKGIGTILINKILDAADLLNVQIKAIPIPLDKSSFDFESKRKLRDWYKSFGFQSKSSLTPALYYTPNK